MKLTNRCGPFDGEAAAFCLAIEEQMERQRGRLSRVAAYAVLNVLAEVARTQLHMETEHIVKEWRNEQPNP